MPLNNRLHLKFNFSPPQIQASQAAPNTASSQSTLEHLKDNFERLQLQLGREPQHQYFKLAPYAPDYLAMRQSGFATSHNGYRSSNSREDVFIHVRREERQSHGEFDGDKFHISVKREDLARAFDGLSSLLFSEDSPIDKWKVTDMERVEPSARVSEGAQFTLYMKPQGSDSHYEASELNRIKHFVSQLEGVLHELQVPAGQHPDSDVRPDHWQYTSYRNELRSQREGNEAQSLALSSEPFYRLMAEEEAATQGGLPA
ncbi:type III effector phosphothreonine lyase [Pseudomonas sp. NPDC087346]|uniref:type III effector phosphothreonine lyase n=1 Tax=Pseudomonas sp. NPDC087346 TaxID=3364438 RepID=UPI00381A1BC9